MNKTKLCPHKTDILGLQTKEKKPNLTIKGEFRDTELQSLGELPYSKTILI